MSDALERALEIFQEKEWIRGNLYQYSRMHRGEMRTFRTNAWLDQLGLEEDINGVCAEGACLLAAAYTGKPFFSPLFGWLSASAMDLFPDLVKEPVGLHDINDDPRFTKEDMILIFKYAIEEAREAERECDGTA